MKKRAFNKLIRECSVTRGGQKYLNPEKVLTLDIEQRHDAALYIIRNRGPVLQELITELMDESWLCATGYLPEYTLKNNIGTFRSDASWAIKQK